MSPRQRSPINRPLPDNLRVREGYYSYRNPETGKESGLGRNRQHAVNEAIRANAYFAAKKPSLIDRITGASTSWSDWCDDFEKLLAERPSAENTIRVRKSQMVRLRKCFSADKPLSSITTADCSEVIKSLKAEGKMRTAQAFRAFFKDCFDRAIAQGKRATNPADVLDPVSVTVRRARLQFDVFQRLYEAEKTPWAKNAYALALVSGQDRESCANAQFKDIREGAWWNERGKTGARIVLPLELRLECFCMSLADVVKQCRSTGVLSHYLIHQTHTYGNSPRGAQIWIDTITRHFSATLATLELDWGTKNPPTFHEIRSLSGRLYKREKHVNPQELLGHKDPKTTAIYMDERGEWVRVGIS